MPGPNDRVPPPLRRLLAHNVKWANAVRTRSPEFFANLAHQQKPKYLWIGCSDSRVPANQIVGLLPGEIFVHRNVANLVYRADPNALAVLHFAVDVLRVRHIIVCGHYGCGGIAAAMHGRNPSVVDAWLHQVKDVAHENAAALRALRTRKGKLERLAELNVIRQVQNVTRTPIVQAAWKRRRDLTVSGWIYHVEDGLLRDLGVTVRGEGAA